MTSRRPSLFGGQTHAAFLIATRDELARRAYLRKHATASDLLACGTAV